MEKESLRKWLDLQAKCYKELFSNRVLNEDIKNIEIGVEKVHILGGRIICKTLGIESIEEPWECTGSTATRISFEWNGVNFFTLEDFKEGE